MISLAGYVLIVNVLAYGAMVLDKAKTLLSLAEVGGSAGAVLAQQMVRHKTRKEPFRSQLIRIIALQIVAIITLSIALIVAGSPEAFWNAIVSLTRGGS
ncbi:DUF1294 domain-containing protein [Aureimonas sp. Leaf427]|uniref:DUF1294 domain-containing protein n=1 Tax=Aureimonas sp. Leaf427 TaxID=1736375 RepID=UPI0039B72146